jgi:hypothetical protein
MAEAKDPPSNPTRDELLSQLKTWLDVYKHHFDLYVKGVAFYLAAAGALSGLIFREGATMAARRTLAIVLTIFCIGAVVGSFLSWRFVARLREDTDAIAAALGIRPFPFSGARSITLLFSCIAAALTVAALIIAAGLIHP